MTAGQRLDGPTEPHDDSCREVLAYTLDQISLAIEETERLQSVLAPTLVYGRAWLTRTDDGPTATD